MTPRTRYIEEQAQRLAIDLIDLLHGDSRVSPSNIRQAVGCIVVGEYSVARELLLLDHTDRGPSSGALNAGLVFLRHGKPATAYQTMLAYMVDREAAR